MSSSKVTRICVEQVLPEHLDHYTSIKNDPKLSAAFWRGKLWPQNSTITISFLDDPSPNQPRTSIATMLKVGRNIDPLQKTLANAPLKEAFKEVIAKRIQPLINLQLKFVADKDNDADIRVSFADEDASWSLVGTDARHPAAKIRGASMNVGWFDVGTYIHECGHALGMIHEHQNDSHGSISIKWDKPKLYSYMESTQDWDKEQVDTNVIHKYNLNQINGSEFDPLSVMLYFFPASLTTNGKGTRQNFSLSGVDTEWISKSYPGGPVNPKVFYPTAYGQSLDSSIAKSNKLRADMNDSGGNHHVLIYVIIGISSALLLAGLIFWLVRRYRSKK